MKELTNEEIRELAIIGQDTVSYAEKIIAKKNLTLSEHINLLNIAMGAGYAALIKANYEYSTKELSFEDFTKHCLTPIYMFLD